MKLFTLLTAAASLLIVSACASTPVSTDERVKIEVAGETDVQPGIVYVSPDAAKIFTLRDAEKPADERHDIETEINESGFLAVRVFGRTAELSALKWAFCGDITYDFGYQFVWFDADGNRVTADAAPRLRNTIPGDPVRFVGHAPAEEIRNFALILKTVDECDLSASNASASDAEAAEAAEKDAETEAAEATETGAAKAETKKIEGMIPELPQENVSGDDQDVKTIGAGGTDSAEKK